MQAIPLTDQKELLIRLQRGDRAAFTILFHQHKEAITARLYALLKIDDLVEDALQEVFFRVWEKRSKIDPEKSFDAYLLRIASNLAYDHFRKLAREKRYENVIKEVPQNEENYQEQLDTALYAIINQLPLQRRKIYILCKFENKTYEEVGYLLGISAHAVKDNVVKANKFLKENYSKIALLLAYGIAIYAQKKFFLIFFHFALPEWRLSAY